MPLTQTDSADTIQALESKLEQLKAELAVERSIVRAFVPTGLANFLRSCKRDDNDD